MLLLTAAARADDVPPQIEAVRMQQRLGNQVPGYLFFRDETGRKVLLERYFKNRPIILVLAYYRCPRLCNQVLNNLAESMRQLPFKLGEDYTVVTVSIDPREQPELAAAKKKAYLEHFGMPGAKPDWHFLTGESEEIDRLSTAVGFRHQYDPRKDEYQHSAGIMILTPAGKVARYLFGVQYAPRDLRLALAEASGGNIGTPVEQVLLLACMTYDPDKGRYSIAAMKLMRSAAFVTLLAVLGYVGWNWRRERRGGRLCWHKRV